MISFHFRQAGLTLLVLSLVFLLDGCATQQTKIGTSKSVWDNPDWSTQAFYSQNELSKIQFKNDLRNIAGKRLKDVQRKRAGVRVLAGSRSIRAYAQLFAEELDEGNDADLRPGAMVALDDFYGIGGGVKGAAPLKELTPDVRLVLPFEAGLNLVIGDGRFTEPAGGSLLAPGAAQTSLAYIEAELAAGIGIDCYGFQSSLGFYLSTFKGSTNEDLTVGGDPDETAFKASNAGAFVDLRYQHESAPFQAGLRGNFGDVAGFEFFVGLAL